MHLGSYLGQFSYIGVFLTLALSGYIFPVPEEIILLGTGYLIAAGLTSAVPIIIVATLGVLVGDTCIYYICHHGGKLARKLAGKVEHSHASQYGSWQKHHAALAIFSIRFVPGMRFLSPVIAGLTKVHWRTFIFWDSLAAIIFVPGVIWLGYFFHDKINNAIRVARGIRHVIFIGSIWLIVLFLFTFFMYWLFERAS